MQNILLSPPVTFMIFLGLAFCISLISKRIAAVGVDSEDKAQAYACGETLSQNQGQPDYTEFFKFAFFFTIMHVVVLVVATDPNGLSISSGVYLGVSVLALFMLHRKP